MRKPQRELDIRLGCSWHVVVGEGYSFSIDHEQVDNLTTFLCWDFITTLHFLAI